jgi:hypothetical protein
MYQELYFASIAVFSLFLDLFFMQLFSQQCLYFLFIFSLITLSKKHSWMFIFFIFSLLAIESILIHNTIGIDFFAAFFGYIFAWFMLDKAASQKWLLFITLIFFIITVSHTLILSSHWRYLPCLCTSLRFIGNFIMLHFSLKWLSAVKRGNRF